MSTNPKNPTRAFLIDESLSKRLARFLNAAGYSAASVQLDPKLAEQTDSVIFRHARANHQTIITRDTDFLKSKEFPTPHAGLIVVRLPGDTSAADIMGAVLAGLLSLAGQDLTNHVYELRLDGVRQIS